MDIDELLRAAPKYPQRIVCMTEETTEILFRLGLGDRVVGVSGFTVRPAEARKKPRISSFLEADDEKILELEPDVVLGFSDLQAELGARLAKRGIPVIIFNQRSLSEILQNIRVVASLVGASAAGETLATELELGLRATAERAKLLPKNPRVFFEEWHEPLISGIRWCSELVEVCGGIEVCSETRTQQGAAGRIFTPEVVAARDPEVVIASWCGRKAKRDKIVNRPGWANVTAVKNDQLYEIRSPFILQPGPAALTDGLAHIERIIRAVAHGEQLPVPRQSDLRGAGVKPLYSTHGVASD